MPYPALNRRVEICSIVNKPSSHKRTAHEVILNADIATSVAAARDKAQRAYLVLISENVYYYDVRKSGSMFL